MINYDLPLNPMKIEQRIGRIHRGQEKEVVIYNLCATGSDEDYILEVLGKKINMFELVIGEIDIILGRIRGEKEFPEMAYDIRIQSDSETERKKSLVNWLPAVPELQPGMSCVQKMTKLFYDNFLLIIIFTTG
ncbi:MAG: hypothetical protein BA867_00665 [Desulfobacterales bacterium S5133MH16]|nr:MAG: hypothetical protein BA867_00665 [Desulfobacterales bacterium S5133MH16]